MSKLIVPKNRPSDWQKLDNLNWPAEWPYKPEVKFRIWHTGDVLHLEYEVNEQSVRAEEGRDGHDVYMDSCVEFFFQPRPEDPHYYNFEFNAAGTMVVSWRTGRNDPEDAPAEVFSLVKREASLGRETFTERPAGGPWTLRADIPAAALWRSGLKSFNGLRARGNYYKCGDGLKVPHFVTFAPISTPKPDYHRPEFFIPIDFE